MPTISQTGSKPTAKPKGKVTAAIARRRTFSASDARASIKARYDVARTTAENTNLWAGTDSLSSASANSPSVRKTIRERARYEVANNSYARGITKTLTNDTVGPQIQLQIGDSNIAQDVERDFMAWAHEIDLWQKIRTMRTAKCVDGEVFGTLTKNRALKNEVKIDLNPIECDMVESYFTGGGGMLKPNEIDGIRFDSNGYPSQYRILKEHPGDYRSLKSGGAGDWISAKYVLHYFGHQRPGQVRGVSELTPALTLFGQLRRFTSAVIECSTRAAEISAVMYTTLVPDQLSAELADPVTVIPSERNAILSLPEGWQAMQLKAEQPTTTYEMFKSEIINEIARCLDMPFNVAAGNSSGYNYASGRLDHQTYDRSIMVERADLQDMVLDRCFWAWFEEYAIRKSLSAKEIASAENHAWYFTGRGHVDPKKEADADGVRLANKTLNLSAYYAKQGKDWKHEVGQWMREQAHLEQEWNAAREDAGLEPRPYPGSESPAPPTAPPAPPDIEDDDGEDEDEPNTQE